MGSPSEDELIASCAGCGASIYREHVNRRLAGRWAGDLYCSRCLAERQQAGGGPDLAPLSLADELEGGDRGQKSAVMGGSSVGLSDSTAGEAVSYKRPLNPAGQGATRVRTFHAKLSDAATRNMDRQVNVWLDNHPEIEIKFAAATVGLWEGKHSEPNLILTFFY